VPRKDSGTQRRSTENTTTRATEVCNANRVPIHILAPLPIKGSNVCRSFLAPLPHGAILISECSSAPCPRPKPWTLFFPLPSGMSSGVEVPGSQRRPGIWSYFSFPGPRRRPLSVTLPRNFDPNRDADPHEKPDRHSRHRSTNSNGFMGDYKGSSIMNQGQRLRYLKTGGVIAFILLVLYFIAPSSGLSRGG
jgi:hypothetical protein